MSGITTIERLVLESLGQSSKEIPALMQDTKLELRFLANILHALTLRGLIVRTGEGYSLNNKIVVSNSDDINNFAAKKTEATELISGLLTPHDSPLKLRKVYLNDRDRTILRGLLKNIENFVNGLPSPSKNNPTHSWSVVVCGEDRYGSIINRLIQEA